MNTNYIQTETLTTGINDLQTNHVVRMRDSNLLLFLDKDPHRKTFFKKNVHKKKLIVHKINQIE
jgi:hypothetical protein